ncbi:MAG: sulfatase-like hydrolase/transferase [Gemmatimonadetes bacterium]|nr:sulfatase-like hydrolase/transferase [Gemmatimonadota bacterium]
MSVYGYNRRTTPTLERLASEGVVFERAYSNSSWTLPSTASFMTSLHTSVTGGMRCGQPCACRGRDHGRAHAPGRLPDRGVHGEPQRRNVERSPARRRSVPGGLGGLLLLRWE